MVAVTVPPVVTAVIVGVLYPVSATPPIVTLPSKLLSPPVNKLVWLSIFIIPFCGIVTSADSAYDETNAVVPSLLLVLALDCTTCAVLVLPLIDTDVDVVVLSDVIDVQLPYEPPLSFTLYSISNFLVVPLLAAPKDETFKDIANVSLFGVYVTDENPGATIATVTVDVVWCLTLKFVACDIFTLWVYEPVEV